MRIRVLPFLLCLLAVRANAQFSLNQPERNYKPKSFAPGVLEEFKKTTTFFFVRVGEEEWIDDLQRELDKVWTITPIQVRSIAEQGALNKEYPIGSISQVMITCVKFSAGVLSTVHPMLSLRMTQRNKKGDWEVISLVATDLHFSTESMQYVTNMPNYYEDAGTYLNTDAVLRNWTKGTALKYLQCMQGLLEKGEKRWIYEDLVDKQELAKLKTSKLYVMDHVTIDFNKMNLKESPMADPRELFEKYAYPYELISAEALSQKIMEEEEPFYYLVYVKSASAKFVTIYRSDTGNMVYSKFSPGFKFKPSDMSELGSMIKRQ